MAKLTKEQLAQAFDEISALVVKHEAHLIIGQDGIELYDRCMEPVTRGQDGANAVAVLHDL